MDKDATTTIEELRSRVREYIRARAWERYHNPKNVAESICIEAAELLERFQWATLEESLSCKENPTKVKLIGGEMADVMIYCLSLANALEIDVTTAITKKLENIEKKYPAEKYHGAWHKPR